MKEDGIERIILEIPQLPLAELRSFQEEKEDFDRAWEDALDKMREKFFKQYKN